MKVRESNFNMTLLQGEEEEKFLKAALEDMKKARQRSHQNKRGGGKHFKGGKNDRKRKNVDNDNEETVPAKHGKQEDKGNNEAVVAAE